MHIRLLPLVVLLFVFNMIKAQTPLQIEYTPNSPDVSSLFSFTDIATGNYTGSANINIPLTSLASGPLSTSVSLSYNSSGHKVSQRATWVGLGWNLNAGGSVAREVRGIADDTDAALGIGFLEFLTYHGFNSINDVGTLSLTNKLNLYDQLSSFGCQDAEPDVFSFRVGELSGSFMFDWDGSLKVACNKKIIVTYTKVLNSNKIDEWVITDDLGNKYVFNKKEVNDRTGFFGMGNLNCSNAPYTTAWKLTSMQDHSGQHQIDFIYEDYTMNYPIEYSKQHQVNLAGGNGSFSNSGSGLDIDGSYIKTITVNNTQEKIEFAKDMANSRTDVTGTNLYPLGSIKTKDNHSKTISEYTFEYTQGNRLKLNKINKVALAETLDYYAFEYNNLGLPNYDSYATDHWGYSNGVSNSVPYPAYTFSNINGNIISLMGADKNPNAVQSEASVLKKIVYPTKGYSEFTYEGHDYSYIQSNTIFS